MKRTIPIITGLVLVLAIPITLFWLCTRPVPSLDGNGYCPGLDKAVTVRFDAHAVPYIEAYSEQDVYHAQGYVTARERMFQMDMLRRAALGELSQVYGIDTLPSDRLMRSLGIRALAEAEWQNLSPQAKDALDSYAHGVNAYLANGADKLPVEFALLGYQPRTWRPQESLAVMKYLAYRMDESWRLDDFRQRVQNKVGEKLASQIFRDDIVPFGLPSNAGQKPQNMTQPGGVKPAPTLPTRTRQIPRPSVGAAQPEAAERTALLDGLEHFGKQAQATESGQPLWGSTAWAVPAAATAKGNGLIACDKDGAFTAPSEWFLCSLNAPQMHVAGASVPGVPGIFIGRNEGVAWGSANLKADVQDIFLEEFKSQFDITYKIPGGWTEAERKTELIPVRFGNDVEHQIFKTRHGPVLLRVNQAAISLAWTGFNTDKPAFESLFKLNHAETIADVNKALADYSDPPQLFVFTDRSGNVGYQMSGNIPLRIGAGQGTMLNTGWENKGAWQGFVAADKLPKAMVPKTSGEGASKLPIVAANQCPSSSGSILPKLDSNVFLGHQWQPPYRANRLLAAIQNATTNGTISSVEMNQLQGDQFSQLAETVTKSLQDAALATHWVDNNGIASVTSMVKWDKQLRGSGSQATVVQAYLQMLMRRALQPKLGPELTLEYLQRWPLWLTQADLILRTKPQDMLPPEERSYNTFLLTTMVQAMKSLHISYGDDSAYSWKWGTVHQALFRDWASNYGSWFTRFTRLGPLGVGGANECVNSLEVKPDANGLTYWCTTGPTERMIVDMSDTDKFYQSVAPGQSGHLFSQYRSDQLQSWVKVDLIPIAFSPNQIMRQTQHRLVLNNEFGSK